MALQYLQEQLDNSEDLGNPWHHHFYKALSDLFHGAVTAQNVAEFITSLEDISDESKIEGTLWIIWSEIWIIAKKDQGVQQHLLDLLETLSRQPDVSQCYGMTVWRDLPIFGWEARERFNYFDLQVDDPPEDEGPLCPPDLLDTKMFDEYIATLRSEEHRQEKAEKRSKKIAQRERERLEYENQNAFLAKLTELSQREDIPPLNFELYGLWTMRSALEGGESWMPEFATIKRYGKTVDNPTHLDGSVPAAAEWIFHCGLEMLKSQTDFTPRRREQGQPGSGGALWEGKQGYCRERWDLWQNRMGEVAEMPDVMKRTRDFARRAYEKMNLLCETGC